ncbi:class I SAM-dependent rRNA methyltransferase [Virgibacillus halophilus]|uniref:class I SAM-dependent rRNA methyltransferase n=1 Tax=Tigheibacillus halophilus TaxID=361280 RepID=UPI00363AC517
MWEIQLKDSFAKRYSNGYPLITKDTVQSMPDRMEEGSIVQLTDAKKRFIGKGYYGIQNKGLGWMLTQQQEETIDAAFFKQKIKSALDRRKSFFQDNSTDAFRVFNGEGDGIGGLVIDYFAGSYLIQWYSQGIFTFKSMIVQALDATTDYQAIYEKKRFDTKGQYVEDDDFVKGKRQTFPIIIKESGMRYAVDLNDGAMVGIFLDQRDVRRTIREKYAKNKHVLNTFSYTGAFSVAAALGNAAKTTSVDLAKRSKPKTIEQFSANDIDFEKQDIIVMDVFDYFKYARRKKLLFDLVVLDPPSFARSKKRTFSTAKDYPMLMKEAISITEKQGIIIASTNNASFGMKKFKGFIDKAFRETNTRYTFLEQFSLPNDFRTNPHFPEGNYLKVAVVKKES